MISGKGRNLLVGSALGLAVLLPTATLAQDKGASAKPDLGKGQQIVNSFCSTCHGPDGNSPLATNPKVAGQHAAYLYRQLVDLAKPASDKTARVSTVMAGFAGQLSDQDRRDVAAFFASQTPKPGAARDKDTLPIGQRIYRTGIADKGVPACAGCHGPGGAGIPSQYPRLAGQHAEYTESQLRAFRDGTRRNSVPMMQIAARMSDAEIKAIADYIDGLR
jgi:cytochrome c553